MAADYRSVRYLIALAVFAEGAGSALLVAPFAALHPWLLAFGLANAAGGLAIGYGTWRRPS